MPVTSKESQVFYVPRGRWGNGVVSLQAGWNRVEDIGKALKSAGFEARVARGDIREAYTPSGVTDITALGEPAALLEVGACADPHKLLSWVNQEMAHKHPRPAMIAAIDQRKLPLLKRMDRTTLRNFAPLEYKRRVTDIPTMLFIEKALGLK